MRLFFLPILLVSQWMGIQYFHYGGIHHDYNCGYPSIMTPLKMGKTKDLYWQDLFVKNMITPFQRHHVSNYTPHENKCFNQRNQNYCVAFVSLLIN